MVGGQWPSADWMIIDKDIAESYLGKGSTSCHGWRPVSTDLESIHKPMAQRPVENEIERSAESSMGLSRASGYGLVFSFQQGVNPATESGIPKAV